jgi:transcriptional regulator with XRE-family HTH domain
MSEPILGAKIREFRQRAGMSQFDLELELGMSAGSLSRIENNQTNPTKETILNLIRVLDIKHSEASVLFNLNVKQELVEFIKALKELNTIADQSELLKLINNKIIKLVDVSFSAVMLWNEKKKRLEFGELTFPSKARQIVEKSTGVKIEDIYFDANNPEHIKNNMLRCLLQNRTLVTHTLRDISVPYLNNQISDITGKLLETKTIVSIPITYGQEKIGVVGIFWKQSDTSSEDIDILVNFVDQFGLMIKKNRDHQVLLNKVQNLETKLKKK